MLANLGFLPELPYSALEMMRPPVLPSDSNYAIVQGSDAHHISHIARRSCYIEAQSASFDGIKKALSERHIYYRS